MGYVSTLMGIQSAFEKAGIHFLDNEPGGWDRGSAQRTEPVKPRPAAAWFDFFDPGTCLNIILSAIVLSVMVGGGCASSRPSRLPASRTGKGSPMRNFAKPYDA